MALVETKGGECIPVYRSTIMYCIWYVIYTIKFAKYAIAERERVVGRDTLHLVQDLDVSL